MKLCFVCPHAYPLFNPESPGLPGGTELQMYNLSRFSASQDDMAVDFVVADQGQKDGERYDNVRVWKCFVPKADPSTTGKLLLVTKLFTVLARSRADIYVASPAGPLVGLIAIFCRIFGRRFIYRTAHQIDCDGSYEKQNGWRGRLYGRGLRAADAIVTQNIEHRQILADRGITSEIIRNAFRIEDASTPPPERSVDALWIARCVSWKNPDMFVDLAREIADRSFVMICRPDPEHAELFDSIAQRARLVPNLRFIPGAPPEEASAWFARSRSFVGTSEYEGFPNTFLQACMAGTPVLSYNVNPDGFITRYAVGAFAGGRFDRLVESTRALLVEQAQWDACSQNARSYVEKHHNIEVEGRKWMRLFQTLHARGSMKAHSPERANGAGD